MTHTLHCALLQNASREAPVGVLWGNDVSHPLLPLAQVRHPLLGQCENSGIFSNAALISWAALGKARHSCRRAAICGCVSRAD